MPGEKLLELAKRCEQAAGPDRLIDLTIHATLRPEAYADPREAKQYASLDYQRGMNRADWYYLSELDPPLLRYTTSLDAAMTLVPEGWWFITGNGQGADRHNYAEAFRGLGESEIARAATLALALCAAALRARASTKGEVA